MDTQKSWGKENDETLHRVQTILLIDSKKIETSVTNSKLN